MLFGSFHLFYGRMMNFLLDLFLLKVTFLALYLSHQIMAILISITWSVWSQFLCMEKSGSSRYFDIPMFRCTYISTIRNIGLSNHWYSPIVRHHYTVAIYRQYRTDVSTIYQASCVIGYIFNPRMFIKLQPSNRENM